MTHTEQTHEATELELYIVNTYDAYQAYYVPAARKLARMWRTGQWDILRARRIMTAAVREAAASYTREYGSMFGPTIFTQDDINEVAYSLRVSLVDEFKIDPENTTDKRWS